MAAEEFDWSEIQKRLPPPEKIRNLILIFMAIIVLLVALLTSFYTVETNEQAVILRFGKYHQTTEAGFHFKLPFGIDKVHKRPVDLQYRETFGYRSQGGVQTQYDYSNPADRIDSLMLTADINLVIVTWDVQYTINDLTNYTFEVRDVPKTIRDISVAVMRKEVGDHSVDVVMVTQRETIQTKVRKEMQALLDSMGAGVSVDQVNLDRTDPPEQVKAAFNRVNQARQVRERLINEAKGEYNEKIPAAEGQKKRLISEAEGYKSNRTNRAEGDAAAFLNVLTEYNKAKDITRRRLYLESLATALPQVNELLLVEGEGSNLLKLLDIKKQGGLSQ